MGLHDTSDLWWKNQVVYCLDVETFRDGDGDGSGDFKGLLEAIDYLSELGVTCLWLLPFYFSPERDDGYDVSDFYGVHPSLGSLGDLVECIRTAQDRGMRVIADLVVNHTSYWHPWFQSARASRDSPYRDFYVWADEPTGDDTAIEFPDAERSNWQWDERAGQYYLHRFYREQPDLNFANPAVREEIHRVIGFWLRMGLSGFRVDAVPFLISEEKTRSHNADPHALLRDLRWFLSRRQGDAVLLGEVNLPPEEELDFFGGEHGDELHMAFNFALNQKLHLALARGEAGPLREALRELPELPTQNQWANFVRNHDELNLNQLTEEEREEVLDKFAPDPDMRLFGRGLRRRLPSMVDGDRRQIRLAYSLLFSLPGTPVLLYGEEIGMAENLAIPGRLSVRTPMQWSGERHGGFSTNDTPLLARPHTTGRFGPESVNVTDQRRDPHSLLNWMQRLISRRRECPEIGWGRVQVLDGHDDAVLIHRFDWDGRTLVAAHNLAPRPARATVKLGQDDDMVGSLDMLGEEGYQDLPPDASELELDLDPYGHRWVRLHRRGHQLPL